MPDRGGFGSAAVVLAALALACAGQHLRLYDQERPADAALFFVAGAFLFAGQVARSRLQLPVSQRETAPPETAPRWWLLPFAFALALVAWYSVGGNRFTTISVGAWVLAIVLFVAALWTPRLPTLTPGVMRDRHTVAALAIFALAVFFRFYRLDSVPPDVTSDHVEKLFDVYDVLSGRSPVFFERNTGREPMQFYLTAALISAFDTGLTFYSLKLGNALMGLLTVLGVYLLGREVGGKRLALLAAAVAAVSIWPVATGRMGLRYPFAPAFTSLALWSLLRALRTRRRADWLLGGLLLGAGLHGYTAFRAMPLAAGLLVAIQVLAHFRPALAQWRRWAGNLAVYLAASAVVFLPLGRYMVDRPDMFWSRTFTRVGEAERALPGNPLALLASNAIKTLGMFNWRGDEVWVNSLPLAPALDTLGGGLFLLGTVYLAFGLRRARPLLAAQLAAAGLVLLLPSVLNLAFPGESPSVVRAGGAVPVVALLSGLALQYIAAAARGLVPPARAGLASGAVLVALVGTLTWLNYDRYFNAYAANYARSAMNIHEVAGAIREHVGRGIAVEAVFFKAWPHWLDGRGLGLELAGRPGWEVEHDSTDLQALLQGAAEREGSLLFVLHPRDAEALAALRAAYPTGTVEHRRSANEGKDWLFFVVSR